MVCGSVVAASGFDLCLSKHKMSYEKALAIRVCRHSLPIGTNNGVLKLKMNVYYSREIVWYVER